MSRISLAVLLCVENRAETGCCREPDVHIHATTISKPVMADANASIPMSWTLYALNYVTERLVLFVRAALPWWFSMG